MRFPVRAVLLAARRSRPMGRGQPLPDLGEEPGSPGHVNVRFPTFSVSEIPAPAPAGMLPQSAGVTGWLVGGDLYQVPIGIQQVDGPRDLVVRLAEVDPRGGQLGARFGVALPGNSESNMCQRLERGWLDRLPAAALGPPRYGGDTLTRKMSEVQLAESNPALAKVRTAWRTWEARAVSPGSIAAQESASLMILLGRSAAGTASRSMRWYPRNSTLSAVLGWPRTLALMAATAFSMALAGLDHPASLRAAGFASS